ncbi:MAG: lysylphosphatidylglycerol synthase domain-containing protein, partial [Bacteroidota bacterium]
LWRRLTRLVMVQDRRRTNFAALLCGYSLGFLTPGRLGELAGRSFYHDHDDRWQLSALVLFQRMIDMLIGVTVGLGAVLLFIIFEQPEAALAWFAIAAVGVVTVPTLAGLLFYPAPAYRVVSRWVSNDRLLKPVEFLTRIERMQTAPYLGLATGRLLVFVSQFVFLFFAFEAAADIATTYRGALMTFYGKFLIPSITIMDIGIREGSAVFFMGASGLSRAAAFNAALFLFVINLVLPSLAGVPFVLRLRTGRGKTAPSSTQS